MDTDDLSEEAYEAVIKKAERFHHDLSLQFGVLASNCKDESEYLKQFLLLIKKCESDIEEAIDEIFYDNIPEKSKFKSALDGIKKSIKEVQEILIDKRKYKEW